MTEQQFYEALTALRADHQEQYERFSKDLREGFDKLRDEMRAQNGRVTRLETAREFEEKQAVKRGTWAGIFSAAGLTGVLEGLKHLMSR